MKKITISGIVLIVALVLTASMLAGCGGSGNGSSTEGGEQAKGFDTSSIKTIGDVIDLEGKEETQYAVYDEKVVYAFKKDGTYYRVITSISPEDSKKYMDIDFSQEDYEKQQEDIIRPLEVEKIENLSDQILSQDELDALVGKTGQELQDEGWTGGGSFNLETGEVWMDKGPFEYSVIFDGDLSGENTDDIDIMEATKDLKVKSIEFSSIGDATNLEE